MTTLSPRSLRERAHGLSLGIFAAPLGELAEAERDMARWGAGIMHFDVMDGVFVPQITAGPGFVASLGKTMLRDVHLMVDDPLSHIDAFAEAGADILTVHAEARNARVALDAIRAASDRLGRPILAGLALMPGTPLEDLAPLLDPMPDLLLLLALDPRDATPPDLTRAGERLKALTEMVAPHRPLMAIDGGVSLDTIPAAATSQPDMIVSGSAVFRAADPAAAFAALYRTWADHTGAPGFAEARNA